MKQGFRRIPQIGLAVLYLLLLSFVGQVQSTHGQTGSEQEKQLRHSIELWENVAKNDKVLLVPLPDTWSNQTKKRYIDSRINVSHRGHFVQDPKSGRYYVPMDIDEYEKTGERELINKRASRAQIDSDSKRMKQYVTNERLPKARRELANLQPPVPAATGEAMYKELKDMADLRVKKWERILNEQVKIAPEPGLKDELANLWFWRTNHLHRVAGTLYWKTPAHRAAYREYIDCLDRVYSSRLPTGKQIKDAKGVCYDRIIKPLP